MPFRSSLSLTSAIPSHNIFGNHFVQAGAGDDTIHGGIGVDSLYGGDGNDKLYGDDNVDNLHGDAGNDFLSGGNGNDYLYGGMGNDILHGDNGNDMLDGGPGNDFLSGDAGNDFLQGYTGDDYLFGGAGNDILFGGDGNDFLRGDAGNDLLDGGNGRDQIWGGAGADTIINEGYGLDDTILVYQGDSPAITGQADTIITGNGFNFATIELNGSTEFSASSADHPTAYTFATSVEGAAAEASVQMADWYANAAADGRYDGNAPQSHAIYLYNATQNQGYLVADLDHNGSYETGIILPGVNPTQFGLMYPVDEHLG